MERVQDNGQWSLFCPNEAPGLADCWGSEFETLYMKYEKAVILLFHFQIMMQLTSGFYFTNSSFTYIRERQRKLLQLRTSGLRF